MAKKQKRPKDPTPTTPTLETLRLADLVPHPDQASCVRPHGSHERSLLALDIEANGVKHAPEVLPPGNAAGLPAYTILSGHTRREIMLGLGQTEAQVCVRYDLVGASRAEVKVVFLADNLARRQMTRLDKARSAVAMFEAKREARGERPGGDHLARGELRDEIGRITGFSGRMLGRWCNVLRCPNVVQAAFEAKRIKIAHAERVARLPPAEMDRLVGLLKAGEDPGPVLAVAAERVDAGRSIGLAITMFHRHLIRGAREMAPFVDKVSRTWVEGALANLREAKAVVDALIKRAKG